MTKLVGEWLKTGSTQGIFDAYARNGFRLYFVGGCVRNALLGVDVSDFDMSSDARPDVAQTFLEEAGYHVIPTGIDHGTLTVVAGGIPHEITTFRKDVATDGRRATVSYSDSLEDDARRRDFTINALYADREGEVLDPLNGLPDIAARRVRFIEDPDQRIKEDYLRILRFFRFHARFAQEPPDADTLHAIASNLDGLHRLSSERITSETLRILALPNPAPALGTMQQIGVLNAVLPGADTAALAPFIHLQESLGIAPDGVSRLAALGAPDMLNALRLSNADRKQVEIMREIAGNMMSALELGYRFGGALALNGLALRAALLETPVPAHVREDASRGADAKFPLKARDLPDHIQGKEIGEALRKLEADWIASCFTLTKSDLLG